MKSKKFLAFFLGLAMAASAIFIFSLLSGGKAVFAANISETIGTLKTTAEKAQTLPVETDAAKLIGSIIKRVLAVIGALFLALMIYGGFLWMLGGRSGAENKIAQAKSVLTSAIIGIVVIFSSYTVINFVLQKATALKEGVAPPAAVTGPAVTPPVVSVSPAPGELGGSCVGGQGGDCPAKGLGALSSLATASCSVEPAWTKEGGVYFCLIADKGDRKDDNYKIPKLGFCNSNDELCQRWLFCAGDPQISSAINDVISAVRPAVGLSGTAAGEIDLAMQDTVAAAAAVIEKIDSGTATREDLRTSASSVVTAAQGINLTSAIVAAAAAEAAADGTIAKAQAGGITDVVDNAKILKKEMEDIRSMATDDIVADAEKLVAAVEETAEKASAAASKVMDTAGKKSDPAKAGADMAQKIIDIAEKGRLKYYTDKEKNNNNLGRCIDQFATGESCSFCSGSVGQSYECSWGDCAAWQGYRSTVDQPNVRYYCSAPSLKSRIKPNTISETEQNLIQQGLRCNQNQECDYSQDLYCCNRSFYYCYSSASSYFRCIKKRETNTKCGHTLECQKDVSCVDWERVDGKTGARTVEQYCVGTNKMKEGQRCNEVGDCTGILRCEYKQVGQEWGKFCIR